MMKRLYYIRDNKAESNAPPFLAPNDAVAVRQFTGMQYPKEIPRDDFDLYYLGEFDSVGIMGSHMLNLGKADKDE